MSPNLPLRAIAAAIAALGGQQALANPIGPTVVNGNATFQQSGATLTITNTANAIINWQGFSIDAGELTRFNQPSAASAVLNRVTTAQNPSSILGTLESNGRVFLINPSGITFGQGAVIDVAGLVASSLNLSDADFLSGRMRFGAFPGAGPVVNNGAINTTGAGAPVYLVGPAVANGGVITSPQGEVILAAGNSVEIVNPATPNVSVALSAPGNEALNLGTVLADSGRIGIFAGLINQNGLVQANTAVAGPNGQVVLKATGDVNLAPGSETLAQGGSMAIDAADVSIAANAIAGTQTISASGDLTIEAIDFTAYLERNYGREMSVYASGQQTLHAGGDIRILNPIRGHVLVRGETGQSVHAVGDLTLQAGNVPYVSEVALSSGAHQVLNAANISLVGGNGSESSGVSASGASQSVTTGTLSLKAGAGFSSATLRATAGDQTISASGIELAGGSDWSKAAISSSGEGALQKITVRDGGTLALVGGTGGVANAASVAAWQGAQHIEFAQGGSLTLQGGAGEGSPAEVLAHEGTQLISGSPSISLTGGSGTDVYAVIAARVGPQTLQAADLTMTGGSEAPPAEVWSWPTNFAGLQAPVQRITVNGDLVLNGGGGGARLGGLTDPLFGPDASATDLQLAVAGDVVLNPGTVAGAQAIIGSAGSSITGGSVAVIAGGDITMNSADLHGTGIQTLGNVSLVAGGSITQGENAYVAADAIASESLGVVAQGPISLLGYNQVARFSAVGGGGIAFRNLAGDLTVTGIVANGPLSLWQAGNLSITGGEAPALVYSTGDIDLTVGGELRLIEGIRPQAWARIQTQSRDSTISLHFPNRASGGWFVNGVEGAMRRGQSGLLSGNGAAVLGKTLEVSYGGL